MEIHGRRDKSEYHNGDYTGDLHGEDVDDQDEDDMDGESDDLMDDDMMDKISSSPSIDDGTNTQRRGPSEHFANLLQRTLISSSSTRFTILSQPSMGKQTPQRVIPWFSWTTVIVIGGWSVW